MSRDRDILFADLQRRSKETSPAGNRKLVEALTGQLFLQQRKFIEDRSRFKSLLCPRRAGKSFTAAIYLVICCLSKPSARCVFATLTQKTARSIIWSLLKQLNSGWNMGATFHNTNVTMTFPNGSVIQLAGAESKAEIDKFRGQAFDLFVLDECKSFPPRVLDELVDQVITPALSDYLGTLCLIGTPGNLLRGAFYEATVGSPGVKYRTIVDEDGEKKNIANWSFHSWNTKDNSKMPHIWKDQLRLKARKGWGEDNPIWRREYLGEWVGDDDAFVYKFNSGRNTWVPDPNTDNEFGLPDGHEWQYILGCDLGFDDPFALVVVAFSLTHPDLFQVDEYKQTHMIVADIARCIADYTEKYDEFAAMVGDRGGLAKMVFEELGAIYGIDLIAADKVEKRDHIELLNSDLVEGRIKIIEDSMLSDEWAVLIWQDDKRNKENKGSHNHLSDAFLYSWRYCQHHYFQERVIVPEVGSAAFWKQKTAEDFDVAVAKRRKSRMEAQEWETKLETELGFGKEEQENLW